jgi:UDP-4-amino-4,6-dideoxy-N-acetyl-beta-L-altrosamine N-acetyltransferase
MFKRKDCMLRPIIKSDLELILSWRNSDRVRLYMYNDHIISASEHYNWFERSQTDLYSKHLIFEYQSEPLGVINITQIDIPNTKCYWGFYIGAPESQKGTGLVMGYLGLDYIFNHLDIRKLCSEIFAFNIPSINFHKKLGFQEEGCLNKHILKNGKYENVICMALFKESWLQMREEISTQCFEGECIHE